ncbi:MAG: SIS domain-containing protein [Acidobacteriaceae bacterium]|jgi:glucosamine--fructose-6-phosphate aminotransferase (isomerizing)
MPLQSVTRIFAHQMLCEIYEQPAAIARTLERYLDLSGTTPKFREEPLRAVAALFRQHPDLIIAASGSSRHAGLAAEILLEDLAGLVVDVEYASEYACRSTALRRHPDNPSPVMVLSQSGETADTLAALREAARRGHPTIAVTNVHGSTMAREATVELDTLAGVELAIPATKSFTTQLTLMLVLALLAARERGALAKDAIETMLAALAGVPDSIAAQLPAWERTIAALAPLYSDAQNFLYLGRGVHYAIAREGALKLKESSYLHAEGYPAGELKHGPNALVSAHVPLVVLATVDADDPESLLRYEKTVSLLYDMREQGARVLALANAGDTTIASLATHTIWIEPACESLLPIAEVVPLQLFAYTMAVSHGVDVDRPRNLTKAVTTE